MATDYLAQVDAFLAASRQFQRAVQSNEDLSESADELERASAVGGGQGYQSFRFSAESGSGPSPRQQSPQEATVGVLFEIQTATVLLAAGRALDEVPGEKAAPAELRQAVTELESARNELATPAAAARFRFGGEAATPPPAGQDGASSPEAYRARCTTTLEALVAGAYSTLAGAVTSMGKLDPGKIAEALVDLSKQTRSLAAAGRLIRRGIEKLKAAFEALRRLLGSEALDKVKELVGKIWKDAQERQLARRTLAWALGVEATSREVEQTLTQPGLDGVKLAAGEAALQALDAQYAGQMAVMVNMTKGLTLVTTVLALTPLAGSSAPFLASGYLLLIAAVLLIGMDYVDSGGALGWVDGVGVITKRLRP